MNFKEQFFIPPLLSAEKDSENKLFLKYKEIIFKRLGTKSINLYLKSPLILYFINKLIENQCMAYTGLPTSNK